MKGICIRTLATVLACWFFLHASDAAANHEKVVYSFCNQPNCTDGIFPQPGLLAMNGLLYGTTSLGGANNWGVVFSLDPRAVNNGEAVLHSFCRPQTGQKCKDGYLPNGGLIAVKGILYGTTFSGGDNNEGTVFSLDPATGQEKVIYSFGLGGEEPAGGLVYKKGKLYGTAYRGGGAGWGTVFAVDIRTGTETVIYSFCAVDPTCPDGGNPWPGLIDVQGTLYGTTQVGGDPACSQYGCGTIYSVDPASRTETVLHAFCPGGFDNCTDGETPTALIDEGGTLFGTTWDGGPNQDEGTVFSLDPATGAESVVYGFSVFRAAGTNPNSLISAKGTLYGTAERGGHQGYGTLFSVNPDTGNATVLHSFCAETNCADGANPTSVIAVKRLLYGTATNGGNGTQCQETGGCGAIFSVKP